MIFSKIQILSALGNHVNLVNPVYSFLSTGNCGLPIQRKARLVVESLDGFAKEGVGLSRTVVDGRQSYSSGFSKCTHHVEYDPSLSRLVEMQVMARHNVE